MQFRTLGRTGLKASVIGLGAGGPSRLGQRDDSVRTKAESVALVLRGLDAGINFIDTAEAYRTEAIVGAAIAQRDRGQIIISTKKRLRGERISRGRNCAPACTTACAASAPTTSTCLSFARPAPRTIRLLPARNRPRP